MPTTTYTISAEGASENFAAPDRAAAKEYAAAWLREGWQETSTTNWASGLLTGPGAAPERIRATIDPEEPLCRAGDPDHAWRKDGLQGHGGGVLMQSYCAICGLRCTIDTWATDPETGEQGLRAVTYGFRVEDAE